MHGICAHIKEALESNLTPFHYLGHSEKSAVYEPERGPSPDAEPDGSLILDFLPPEL